MQRVTKYRKLLHIPIQSTSSAFYHTHLELRKSFEDYFKSKGHTHLPSASVVSDNNSEELSRNGGMSQFMRHIPDPNILKYQRFTKIQKCIRVGRKLQTFNDVLGKWGQYQSFFEVMGNWSFDNVYSKKETIENAWDYLVNVLKIDSDRLYVTYFKGNVGGVEVEDHETKKIWEGILGKDSNRIIGKENIYGLDIETFAEIHYDLVGNRNAADLVDNHDSIVQIWNSVFMSKLKLWKNGDSEVIDLGRTHIDTRMGFERLLSVLQEKDSNYDTDVFQPLVDHIKKNIPTRPEHFENWHQKNVRNIADHIRAVTFAISDGVVADSTKQGFVVRNSIRRMILASYRHLKLDRGFLSTLPSIVVKTMGEVYPNLHDKVPKIVAIIENEENRFYQLVDSAQHAINIVKDARAHGIRFDLFKGYGVPLQVFVTVGRTNCFKTQDLEVFVKKIEESKERSKRIRKPLTEKKMYSHDSLVYKKIRKDNGEYDFPTPVVIAMNVADSKGNSCGLQPGETGMIRMVRNNFYFESGGQMADTGVLMRGDKVAFVVDDVVSLNDCVYLKGRALESIRFLHEFKMCINGERRMGLMRGHSGTHVLNWAIQKAGLGNGQKGSKVEADRIRFDYALKDTKSEDDYNSKIAAVEQNLKEALDEKNHMTTRTDIEECEGVKKRIVTLGRCGITEACCGTHVDNIADITDIVIISDKAFKGVRRMTAVTGPIAQQVRKYANDMRGRVMEADKQTIVDIEKEIDWDQVPLTEYAELSKLLREKDEELKKVAEIKNLMTKRKKEPKKKAKNC